MPKQTTRRTKKDYLELKRRIRRFINNPHSCPTFDDLFGRFNLSQEELYSPFFFEECTRLRDQNITELNNGRFKIDDKNYLLSIEENRPIRRSLKHLYNMAKTKQWTGIPPTKYELTCLADYERKNFDTMELSIPTQFFATYCNIPYNKLRSYISRGHITEYKGHIILNSKETDNFLVYISEDPRELKIREETKLKQRQLEILEHDLIQRKIADTCYFDFMQSYTQNMNDIRHHTIEQANKIMEEQLKIGKPTNEAIDAIYDHLEEYISGKTESVKKEQTETQETALKNFRQEQEREVNRSQMQFHTSTSRSSYKYNNTDDFGDLD